MEAWDQITEDLARKSWEGKDYCSSDTISMQENADAVVHCSYSETGLRSVANKAAGDRAMMTWVNEGDGVKESFLEEDEKVAWDLNEDKRVARRSAAAPKPTTKPAAALKPISKWMYLV